MPLKKVVSGGQTGVDRAALDVALELGMACGGWCPRGRRAEDGRIPDHYPLDETSTGNYRTRTRWNVRDSGGTLILCAGPLQGGTALTQSCAESIGRPCLVVDLAGDVDPASVAEWIAANRIEVLNVAGPRASQQPDIFDAAAAFLRSVLKALGDE